MKEPSLFRMKYRGLQVLMYSPADRRRKRYKEVDGRGKKVGINQKVSVYDIKI